MAELIRKIPGLRPVDCGDLELARILEQLTPLLISVNKRHKIKHSGIRHHRARSGSGSASRR